MSKSAFFSKIVLVFVALLVYVEAGCYPCGGSHAPQFSSTPISGSSFQYVAKWGRPNGFDNTGCFWCLASDWNNNNGISSCTGLPSAVTANCTSSYTCTPYNSTIWVSANPSAGNKNTCEATNPIYVSWLFSAIGNLQCGCSNGQVGRNDLMTKYHLPADEFQMVEQAAAIEGRQVTPDCTHSLVCDPSTRSDCPDSSCPAGANAIIPCSSIAGTSQNCPGYLRSPWGTTSCPMRQGGLCPICAQQACSGDFSNLTQCSPYGFNYACLECHVMVLSNGTEVCGAHMAPSASQCFCATNWNTQFCPNQSWREEDEAASKRQVAPQTGGGSNSPGSGAVTSQAPSSNTYQQPNPPVTPPVIHMVGIKYCAPWGSDIQTMHCVAGKGANARIATPADCRAGMAQKPSCSNAYSCGGVICGDLATTSYNAGGLPPI